ncbi:MAG: aldehyde dehydrogenase family protein [Pseudomonadota bacterium]
MNEIGMLIDNESTPAADGRTFERTSPTTSAVASHAPAAGAADVDAAVQAGHRAFPEWSAMGPAQRRAILLKCADALDAKTPEFIALGAAETGGTGPWLGFSQQSTA